MDRGRFTVAATDPARAAERAPTRVLDRCRAPNTVPVVLRTVAGLLCGALVAAFGALILGEYEFTGALPFVAGPLFGLAVGEVVVAVGASRASWVAVVTAMVGFAGILWAGWIDSTEGVEPLKALVWVAAALAAVLGFLRVAGLRAHRT